MLRRSWTGRSPAPGGSSFPSRCVFLAFWVGSGRDRAGSGPAERRQSPGPRSLPALAAGGGGSRCLGQWERCPRASQAMAAAGGDGGPAPAEDGGADIGGGSALAAAPGRAQVFTTVVDTFLEKLVAAGR